MNVRRLPAHHPVSDVDLRAELACRLTRLRELAVGDDKAGAYPAAAMSVLREAGLLDAVLPLSSGGLGLGWMPASTETLFHVLVTLGGAHLSLARLYEGHVNAFALLWNHGSTAQRTRLVDHVQRGGVLGVWNAPSPDGPLRLIDTEDGLILEGKKIYASGAGSLARPLITAQWGDELLMVWTDVTTAQIDLTGWNVQGMRATATGTVDFTGLRVSANELFGGHDAYHRQPAFSGGAWRFVAAQLGAAAALVDALRDSLLQSRRDGDPHQRARLADAAMHVETGRLWTLAAARRTETPDTPGDDAVAYTGMARLVVERAAMEIIALVQRSIGLRSMMAHDPVERIVRDLATYLRQPVPDAIRDAAATHVLASPLPLLDRWTL